MKTFSLIFLLITISFYTLSAQRGNRHNNHDHDYYDDHPFDDDIDRGNYGNNGDYTQAIYWHLVPLGYNTFNISYEMRKRVDGGERSWVFGGGVTLSNKLRRTEKGFLAEIQYRYYFDRMSPVFEMYGAPYGQLRQVTKERWIRNDSGASVQNFDEISSYSAGLLFGLKFYIFQQGILELQGGGGFMISNLEDEALPFYGNQPWEIGYTGIALRGAINIGFAF